MKYRGVAHLKQLGHPIRETCNLLQVSPSGFYTGTSGKPSHRRQKNRECTIMVGNVFHKHKGSYGYPRIHKELHVRPKLKALAICYPRIHKELQHQGVVISRNKVAKILRELELRALPKKAFRPKTTQSDPNAFKAERVFKVESTIITRPNQVWASDLTYIPLKGREHVYLVMVIDLYDRSYGVGM